MRRRLFSRGFKWVGGLLAALPCFAIGPVAADGSGGRQERGLADLAAQIVSCSVHPCLGDAMKDVRAALHDAILSDTVFYYSDLKVAYPSIRGLLQGVVEWDFGGTLDTIGLKVIDFPGEPSDFIGQLERALPGCEMEHDSDGEEAKGDEDEVPLNQWSCLVERQDSEDADMVVYFAPGLVMLEIDL